MNYGQRKLIATLVFMGRYAHLYCQDGPFRFDGAADVLIGNLRHWDATQDASSNLVWNSWSDRYFKVNGATFRQNGNVGIGTSSPNAELDVNGQIIGKNLEIVGANTGTPGLAVNNTWASSSGDYVQNRPFAIRRYGANDEAIHIYVQDLATYFTYVNDEASNAIHFRLINTDNDTGGGVNANDNTVMTIRGDGPGGRVKIGDASTPTGYRLSVDGKAVMEEVNVKLSGNWPDYVFAEDYNLKPLSEIETHIKTNQHLPGTPSSGEVETNGIDLSAMNTLLLKKREELTLYLIDEANHRKAQKALNQQLLQRIQELEIQLENYDKP